MPLNRCSEDPDVKGTETLTFNDSIYPVESCSEDPDVKGTETHGAIVQYTVCARCSEDPDVKGTETEPGELLSRKRWVAARIPM